MTEAMKMIKDLEAAEKKATPDRLSIGTPVNKGKLYGLSDVWECPIRVGELGVNGGQGNAIAFVILGGQGGTSGQREEVEANARMFAATRNSLPLLLRLAREGIAARKVVEAAMMAVDNSDLTDDGRVVEPLDYEDLKAALAAYKETTNDAG